MFLGGTSFSVLALFLFTLTPNVHGIVTVMRGCPANNVEMYGNCTGGHSGCCQEGLLCYKQDDFYSQCRLPGTCPDCDWDCTIIPSLCENPVGERGNCRERGCCEEGLVCYEQDGSYAQCLPEGQCPECSDMWTCNVLQPQLLADYSFLQAADNEEADRFKGTELDGEGFPLAKVLGGVGAGTTIVIVIAWFVVVTRNERAKAKLAEKMQETPLKAELVYSLCDASGGTPLEEGGPKQRKGIKDLFAEKEEDC
mmetsp:Transcript_28535/g.58333  ORF Transcript_28535/g.58333 Transcript_28535/m.58333 type:complete len:253 (+) Transcript_28535:77-835(+)